MFKTVIALIKNFNLTFKLINSKTYTLHHHFMSFEQNTEKEDYF